MVSTGSMSDRNDNNWNSTNSESARNCNRKTSPNKNKSLAANKCSDQMQRTDCDIQTDQLISGTTTDDIADDTTPDTAPDTTPDSTNSQTNDDNQANHKSSDLITSDECPNTDCSDSSPNTEVMQSQERDDQKEDQLSQHLFSNDDSGSHSDSQSTAKRAQNKNNKNMLIVNNDIKPKNDFSANDNSSPKAVSEKRTQEESDVRTDEYKCPVCDLKLDSQHTFTIHIRQHNPSDHSHTCRLCGKTLSSASSLDRHMLIHSGERPFKCRICSMAFTTNGNMHRHMRTHGVDHGNDDTNGTDSHSNRLIKSKKRKVNDEETKDDKVVQKKRDSEMNGTVGTASNRKSEVIGNTEICCPICKKSMTSKSTLHTHMELHPNDSICCLDCGMIVNNYALYTQHRCTGAAIDGTIQLVSNRMNFSSAPAVGFYDLSFTDFSSRKFSLIAKSFCEHNLRKASSPYHEFECDKCKRAFPCGSALNLHQSTHEGQTYCQLCRHDFATPALYLSHQIKHRFDYPTPMTGTIPKALDFRIDSNLSDVQKTSYGDVPHSDKEDFLALLDLQNKGSQLNSIHSNYKFSRSEDSFDNSSYYIHAQPIPPRPTTFHPKVITNGNESESNKHDLADIQSILSVTSSANPLMSTIRSSPPAASPASPVHLGASGAQPDSPVAADSANASPNTPSANSSKTEIDEKLNDSIESNDKSLSIVTEAEDESTPTFKCNKCTLKFKSQNALKRHNRGHTQGGHSYACHLCTYTSLDKSTLVRHLRTHNGERPFQCAICKYAFTTKANCERHVKKRHKKLQKNEIRSAMQYNPNMSTTSSLTQQNLAKNEANLSLSPNSDSFPGGFDTVCKYCNVDFKFNRVLRHHLRSLHNSCSRKPFCCTVCKLGFSTKNNCIRHVVKQHPDMKDRLSSVVLANASAVGLSDHSESESLYHDSTKDSLNITTDNDSMNGFSGTPSMTGSQPNSSLAALCQIAKNISTNEKPMNLAIDSNCNDEDEDTDCSGCDDQPLNLASHSHEEQPLDLAVHALDLSCKSSQSNKEKITEDMKQVNEAVRTAASSLLALRSMTATNIFPQNPLLPTPLQPTLFHPSIPLTPPLPAHSSPSLSMLSPNASSSMDDIYKVTTFRISKNRLLPRNERSFTCVYCSAGFTLKSNMERHIKRKHPEFARPPRGRGMSSAVSQSNPNPSTNSNLANSSLLSKSNANPTLSSKTRAALRVVLNNKVLGSTSGPNSRPSSPMDSSVTNLSIKESEENNNSDQNGDLASVSSLIDHSANSSNALKQYFNKQNEDIDSNGAQSLTNTSLSDTNTEPIRPNISKSENLNGKAPKVVTNKGLSAGLVTKKRSAYTDSPNSVSCPYCSRKFPWTSSLRRHILTHTGLKPYKCPKCPILFTTKSNCERHLIRKHNGREKRSVVDQSLTTQESKPFKCNVCPNSTFTTQGNLRKHYYLRHWTKTGKNNGLKSKKEQKIEEELNEMIAEEEDEEEGTDRLNFKCYICETPFTGRLKCLKHIESSHSNEYQTLQSKGAVDKVPTTQTRLMLDNHNDEYDAYGPEKISCVFCPRYFTLFDNLRRHMRVHLGERPFRCTLCPKKFSLKNSLLRHHRTNHPESVLSTRPKGKSKQQTIPSISSTSLIKETENSSTNKSVKSKGSCNSLLYLIPNESVKESEKFAQNDDSSDLDNGHGSDLIQNLLGLQDSKILDDLLDSGADSAARILGVKDLA